MFFVKLVRMVMNPANDVLTDLGNDMLDCRTLEADEWDYYLENKYITKDVLAYHWKKVAQEPFTEYNKLIKIETNRTNMKLIGMYVIIVIVLGAMGSGLLEVLKIVWRLWK